MSRVARLVDVNQACIKQGPVQICATRSCNVKCGSRLQVSPQLLVLPDVGPRKAALDGGWLSQKSSVLAADVWC